MGLRIDVKTVGVKTLTSISGELLAEGVLELKKALPMTADALEFDLSNLRFADSEGIKALRGLINDGATVIGASPFIKKLLGI